MNVTAPPGLGLRALVALASLLLLECGGPQHDGGTASPSAAESAPLEESSTDEALPAEAGADEAEDGAPCLAGPEDGDAPRTAALLRRWLRDQSVGRRLTVESAVPSCGDRGGALEMRLVLSGAADGLLSLGRALEAYYPGSRWFPVSHERLGSSPLRLRIEVEALVPLGAAPRPRCEWDAAVPCRD